MRTIFFWMLVLLPASLWGLGFDRLKLDNGTEIVGEILKKDNEYVILDLGFDVIKVPKKNVLSIEQVSSPGSEDGKNIFDLYMTGRLSAAPVDELVKQIGDSVLMVKTPSGLGSGFFINDQGYLITNYHVIERETDITVSIFNKTEEGYERRELKKVRIIALHPVRDLALLKIDDEDLKSIAIESVVLAKGDGIGVGSLVFTIGNPLGLERSVSQGIVSSKTRAIGYLRFIQTDAAINP
ncbi:MAG: trypsin-like peptidase domain-containing protein, partial [Opitutaceae bacterium]|nr:trypsin-like peptidase domain-containing protein [Opitutaceae bacterium]